MPLAIEAVAIASILAGSAFFVAGTIGLLRFPDLFTRLHALTKADNVGLGLLLFGVALQTSSIWVVLKLLVIWVLVLLASSSAGHLIARSALRAGTRPWTTP